MAFTKTLMALSAAAALLGQSVQGLAIEARDLPILPVSSDGSIVAGTSHPWIVNVMNAASTQLQLVCWDDSHGYGSSFLEANGPQLSLIVPAGATETFSIATGTSGACAPVYSNTQLNGEGQIANTWWEFTAETNNLMDISRELNMSGDQVSVDGGLGCTATNTHCAFECNFGNSCTEGFHLANCNGPGSDPGDENPATGGCQWEMGTRSMTVG